MDGFRLEDGDGMSQDAAADRRTEERHPARLVVLYSGRGKATGVESSGRTEDVSTGGMFIATRRPLPRRTRLTLEAFLDASDEPAVRVEAVVRWRRRFAEPRGMGVEIMAASEQDRRRLRRWLKQAGGETASAVGRAS